MKWRIDDPKKELDEILVIHESGEPQLANYRFERCCMMGRRAGSYPPGWVDLQNNLPINITKWLDESESIPSVVSNEDQADRIRKLAWESYKNRGLTVFTADDEPDDTEAFCFYEQGFSDAFDHIFKTTEEIKKATG